MVVEPSAVLQELGRSPLRRTIALDRAAINEDSRTANVAFASDKPVDHWFGTLILSMDKKAMRSDRLKNGAAVLVEHDPADQVGVVESFSVAGGVARAEIRFSRSARGEEVFQDVKDGIRRNISVGFMIHELHLESEKDGEMPVYRSDDWEPYEISIVSVPADISVGVGRSSETKGEKYVSKFENTPADTIAARQKELVDWAGIFGEEKLAQRMLLSNSDLTREQLRVAIAAKRDAEPDQVRLPVEDPAGYAARFGYYEPAHSVPRYGRLEGFKGDRAAERAHRFGQWVLGGPFGNRAARQWCQERGLHVTRSQNEGLNEKGGFLVPTEFGNDIVDLIEQYGVFRQNAKVVPMMSDRRVDPVIDGELESQFVGELEEGTDQDLEFGMIGLTVRKHMVLVPMSSEVSEDAAVSIADLVATSASRAFAKKEDNCGFNGDATSTYGGMIGIRAKLKGVDADPANIPGLQVGTGNAYSELTLDDFTGVVGRLPDYADTGNVKWFVSRRFYFNVMVPLLLSGTPTATEIEDSRNRRFLGYPVVFSQVMPTAEANSQVCAIFGDLALGARFGDRRSITIALDDSILFRKDALLLKATSRFDINVHGVGDTTEAGPICGLITAAS